MIADLLKLPIYSEIQAKMEYFAKKVPNIRISQGLLLPKKEKAFLTLYCKIQAHNMNIFLKIVISNIVGLHPPPSPAEFDVLPYLRVRWYPKHLIIKMTAKDVKEIN